MAKVVCAGHATCDLLFRGINKSLFDMDTVYAHDALVFPGGDALNTTVNLHKLGLRNVKYVSTVGNDIYGNYILSYLDEMGIDISGISVKEECSTQVSVVLVDSNSERHFICHGNSAQNITVEDIISQIDSDTKHLHIGSLMTLNGLEYENLLSLFKFAHNNNITTSFDVTYDPTGIWFGRICDALPYTDYLFASFEEAKELSHGLEAPDKIANFFYSNQFKGTFVLKLDKRGCFIANRDQTCNIPACEVLSVVDTTGAGDAFVSAFLFGIINGLSDEESGILGNVNGALAITKLGATSSTANLQNLVSPLQKDYTVHPLKNKLIEKMEMLAFDRTNNAIQV